MVLGIMEAARSGSQQHELVEVTAYYLWQQRGCPIGTPEVDWFRAEQELNEQHASSTTPALIAMAATVGSALGSVAGRVKSVGSFVHSKSDSPSE
jgi:hypothetical protein